MQKEELKYWLALKRNPNIGAITFLKLLKAFGSMEKLWKSPKHILIKKKVKEEIIEAIGELKKTISPELEWQKIQKLKINIVTFKDKEYPKLLKQIPDLPPLLYYQGDLTEDKAPIAIVGSRKYSSYGQQVTKEITKELAENGVTIVSGLALGIDSFAHKVCLEAGGRTIAVLPSGLDKIYPACHQFLAKEIINKGGLLISENPPGTQVWAGNFAVRNRIIAGISKGVLVIEAAQISGTLLTARAALDYNREVFAIPADIYRPTSYGVNNLLKMGAHPVTQAQDILYELNIPYQPKSAIAGFLSPKEREILSFLSREPLHIDGLSRVTKMAMSELLPLLTILEMQGKVKNIGANQYVII
jgi:DNA processing protein